MRVKRSTFATTAMGIELKTISHRSQFADHCEKRSKDGNRAENSAVYPKAPYFSSGTPRPRIARKITSTCGFRCTLRRHSAWHIAQLNAVFHPHAGNSQGLNQIHAATASDRLQGLAEQIGQNPRQRNHENHEDQGRPSPSQRLPSPHEKHDRRDAGNDGNMMRISKIEIRAVNRNNAQKAKNASPHQLPWEGIDVIMSRRYHNKNAQKGKTKKPC